MSCPECGGDTSTLPDYDEKNGTIARLQKIISEQAVEIRRWASRHNEKVAGLETELAEARDEITKAALFPAERERRVMKDRDDQIEQLAAEQKKFQEAMDLWNEQEEGNDRDRKELLDHVQKIEDQLATEQKRREKAEENMYRARREATKFSRELATLRREKGKVEG